MFVFNSPVNIKQCFALYAILQCYLEKFEVIKVLWASTKLIKRVRQVGTRQDNNLKSSRCISLLLILKVWQMPAVE